MCTEDEKKIGVCQFDTQTCYGSKRNDKKLAEKFFLSKKKFKKKV